MVTVYLKVQCLCLVRVNSISISHAKFYNLLNCSITNKYYTKIIPEKDRLVKDTIKESLGLSKIGSLKVLAEVQLRYPAIVQLRIHRAYQNVRYSFYNRLLKKLLNNPSNLIEVHLHQNFEWDIDFMSDCLANGRKIRNMNIID